MRARRKLLILLAGLAGAGAVTARGDSPAWWQDLPVSGSITIEQVNNLSHTAAVTSRKDGMTFRFAADTGSARQVARNWLLSCGGQAEVLVVPEYDRTNAFRAGPNLGLQHKFGLGPLAPFVRITAAGNYQSARLKGDTGWTTEAGVQLGKRLNSSLKIAARAQWLDHAASHATFDVRQRTLLVEAAWDFAEHWRLTASAGRMMGYVVGHAEGVDWAAVRNGSFGPSATDYYRSRPYEVTHSYGADWVSYSVYARVNLWSLAVAREMAERTTLEFRAGHSAVQYKYVLSYPTTSWGLSLIHRF